MLPPGAPPDITKRMVTVIVQNMAALCDVAEAVPAILSSVELCKAHGSASAFLLRPHCSDHLGTVHKISVEGCAADSTVLIVMPEVLRTDDGALKSLPSITLFSKHYKPCRIEYCWGSGKAEIRRYLERAGLRRDQEGCKREKGDSLKFPENSVLVPAEKGLCCVLYKEIRETGTAHQGVTIEPGRSVKIKNKENILTEHIATAHAIPEVTEESGGQSHVGCVYFDAGNILLFGCHLTFKGGAHPDYSGATIRSRQLQVIRETGRAVARRTSRPGTICVVAGDLNLRPMLPSAESIDTCRSLIDKYLCMLPEDFGSEDGGVGAASWGQTRQWGSSGFHLCRNAPRHPPTYPIRSHAHWERIFSIYDGDTAEQRNICTPAAFNTAVESAFAALGPEAIYDSFRKGRFTPPSWTDGVLTFRG